MKPAALLTPQLDIKVESETFQRTFREYEKLTSKTPAQAVEKQAVNLRVKLIRGFLSVKMKKGQARAEMDARGGKLKVRKSIRDRYKGLEVFKGGLIQRNTFDLDYVSKKIQRGKNKGQRRVKAVPAWSRAIQLELAARNRSRSFLAASWLNSFQASDNGQGQNGVFVSKVKSGEVTGQTSVRTTGDAPEITLRNITEGVAKVGFSRGIIARALAETSADMRSYIVRKLQKNAQALPSS